MINRDLTLIVNNGAYKAAFIRYTAGHAQKVIWNITAAEAAHAAAALKTKDPYIINDFCLSL